VLLTEDMFAVMWRKQSHAPETVLDRLGVMHARVPLPQGASGASTSAQGEEDLFGYSFEERVRVLVNECRQAANLCAHDRDLTNQLRSAMRRCFDAGVVSRGAAAQARAAGERKASAEAPSAADVSINPVVSGKTGRKQNKRFKNRGEF